MWPAEYMAERLLPRASHGPLYGRTVAEGSKNLNDWVHGNDKNVEITVSTMKGIQKTKYSFSIEEMRKRGDQKFLKGYVFPPDRTYKQKSAIFQSPDKIYIQGETKDGKWESIQQLFSTGQLIQRAPPQSATPPQLQDPGIGGFGFASWMGTQAPQRDPKPYDAIVDSIFSAIPILISQLGAEYVELRESNEAALRAKLAELKHPDLAADGLRSGDVKSYSMGQLWQAYVERGPYKISYTAQSGPFLGKIHDKVTIFYNNSSIFSFDVPFAGRALAISQDTRTESKRQRDREEWYARIQQSGKISRDRMHAAPFKGDA